MMEAAPDEQRRNSVNALDVGRGIAIVGVMYGHALAPWFMQSSGIFSEAAFLQWKLGASFMMAFFFFLSGVSWRGRKALSSTLRQSLTLILIAILASAAYDFTRMAATLTGLMPQLAEPVDPASFATSLTRMVAFGDYYSFSALWFIVALALVHAMAAVAIRVGKGAVLALAAALLVLTLMSTELGWRNVYQINLIGVAFAFFLAGYAARRFFQTVERRPAAAYALLLIGGVILAATFNLNQGCRWDAAAHCGVPWLSDQFGVAMVAGQFGNLPLFTLTAFAGIAFASALAILLARSGGVVAAKLDAWGGNSLNLLIVNCIFLHVGNQLIERWVAPRLAADNVVFFAGLIAITLAANVAAAHVLDRPLRWLHRTAHLTAREIIGAPAHMVAALAWVQRSDRVSQQND